MRDYDRGATVHGAFARQVRQAPAAVALLERSQQHSYEAIEARSTQLARYLAGRGVGRGDRVALLSERSADTIVAMLAVLKVGAAFVPLDPAYPLQRLAIMLDDAAPMLVLGRMALSPDIAGRSGDRFVDLSAAMAAAAGLPAEPLDEAAAPTDAAYVMYTSGSTGRPKGVVVPHRAIVRLVSDQTYARFAADETILHLAPLAFDASTFEIWGALLSGGRLAIVAQTQPSLDDIVEAIARHGVTAAWFTAGLFHLLVDQRLEGLRPLRQILAGGDVLSPAHVKRARQALPHCRFVNGYGPTENTTFSCCHVITDDAGAIPIGPCIAHSTAYVLDENLEPVAPGEDGQLCVGGDGLAIGYLNLPELTSARFVEVASVGERLYLTGDLARQRPDGVFDFFGRMDRQVKLDGKRVEIEEIEQAIRAEAGVVDAVVVVCDGPEGSRRLAAFVKAADAAGNVTNGNVINGLGERLRRTLPPYMVPSSFAVVPAFPLTANGKIDRDRLIGEARVAHADRPEAGAPAAVAATGIEGQVASIWSAVLGLERVPRDVNFFDLGGTSLLLMSVHARLGALGLPSLPLVALFENPTVASLAARLRGDEPAGESIADGMAARDNSRRAALKRFRNRSMEQQP